jgi:hypothetical protein
VTLRRTAKAPGVPPEVGVPDGQWIELIDNDFPTPKDPDD